MTRLYTRYKALKPRQRPAAGYLWISFLLVAAFAVWFFWPDEREQPSPQPQPKAGMGPNRFSTPPGVPSKPVEQKAGSENQRLVLTTNIAVVYTVSGASGKTRNGVLNASTSQSAAAADAFGRGDELWQLEESFTPRRVRNIFDAQLALAHQGISPGSLDGVLGSQTRAALRAFQEKEGLPATGELDALTQSRLILTAPPLILCAVTTNDLARLRPLGRTWLSKSQQEKLEFETILELVAEKGQASPKFIRRINPEMNWTNLVAGAQVKIPNVGKIPYRTKAAFLKIKLEGKILQAFDLETNLIAQFPCSIASKVEKRPRGKLVVTELALNPNYRFDPEVYPESAEARQLKRPLMLPPGPNNPVGTAWIGLDLPGYGIHGTPRPEEVGRTESHGCFRLANWNAERLIQLVNLNTLVLVEP